MISRERVKKALNFKFPDHPPRDLWILPLSQIEHPGSAEAIQERFPLDIIYAEYTPPQVKCQKGDRYAVGTYIDEWGCVFENRQEGVIGEVKEPIIAQWSALETYRPPTELIGKGLEKVNQFCAETDSFVLGAEYNLFERMQFLRGTENLLMDIMDQTQEFFRLRDMVHEYYMEGLQPWLSTDIDAVSCSDDWGSQQALLIPPRLWRELFKPLYSEYFQAARNAGKHTFMHSDGYIFDVYEDLIEIGVDAINSQLFCMDIEEIGRRFKKRITFWGEVDRQQVLPSPDTETVRDAVKRVYEAIYDPSGGVIAQCSFGAAARPENVEAVFQQWDKLCCEE